MAKDEEEKTIFETLENLREKYLAEDIAQKGIFEERKREIEASEKAIKLAYDEKIRLGNESIANSKKELSSYRELLRKYSTFNSKLIGETLEKLVSMIEGEEYSYQHAIQETTKRESTVFGSETFPAKYNVQWIVCKERGSSYYREFREYGDSIYELVKKGKAILLEKQEGHENKDIQFYSNHYDKLESLVDFGKFDYVKIFIDSVIQYRFQNNMEKISEKELLPFISEFISNNKELMASNYQLRVKEQQEEIERKLRERQEEYNRQVEKMEFEKLLQNGVTSTFTTKLIDRLQESINIDTRFNKLMNQIEISYEGDKGIATVSYEDPFFSTENLFISKINIQSSIKDYFDDSDQDHHFHGFVDINLVDDGLIGIIDISNSDKIDRYSISNHGVYCPFEDGLCKVDKIGDNYLRVLFLPNKCNYSHKPVNPYTWMAEIVTNGITDSKASDNIQQDNEPVSYKTEWNYADEANKMLAYAKKIELLSYLNDNQLKLYKQKVMTK